MGPSHAGAVQGAERVLPSAAVPKSSRPRFRSGDREVQRAREEGTLSSLGRGSWGHPTCLARHLRSASCVPNTEPSTLWLSPPLTSVTVLIMRINHSFGQAGPGGCLSSFSDCIFETRIPMGQPPPTCLIILGVQKRTLWITHLGTTCHPAPPQPHTLAHSVLCPQAHPAPMSASLILAPRGRGWRGLNRHFLHNWQMA